MLALLKRILQRSRAIPAPAMAFDVSNWWLAGPVSVNEATSRMAQAKTQGFAGVMVGVTDVRLAVEQIDAAQRGELWADAYSYQFFDNDDERRLRDAASVKAPGLCWIDCEDEGEGVSTLSQAEVIATIQHRIDLAWSLGMRPAIYTRRQWWITYTGNSAAFASYPLWVADPDEIAVLNAAYWEHIRFGAWALPTWKQYGFNRSVGGMNADVSVGPS